MSNVLILGCGTQGLIMAKDIKKAGHRVILIGDRHNYAYSSRYVDIYISPKNAPSTKEYLGFVLDAIQQYKVEAMVPMGDVLSEFMSENKEQLSQYVMFLMPDIFYWRNAVNKSGLMSICKEKGYPVPLTFTTEEELMASLQEKIPFPLLIKPNITCKTLILIFIISIFSILPL